MRQSPNECVEIAKFKFGWDIVVLDLSLPFLTLTHRATRFWNLDFQLVRKVVINVPSERRMCMHEKVNRRSGCTKILSQGIYSYT